MKAKRILLAATSVTALAVGAGAAPAQDDDYDTYGRYDDQADETRRLNLLQLQNPGAGQAATPPPRGTAAYDADDDMDGPGPAAADAYDDDGMSGPDLSGPPTPDDDDDFDDDDDEAGEDDDELGDDDDEPGAMPGSGDDDHY